MLQIIPGPAERGHLLLVASGGHGRVPHAPMQANGFPEEDGAHFLGAKRDHRVHRGGIDRIHPLGPVGGDVDADFPEGPDRLGANDGGNGSGGGNPHSFRGKRSGDAFGHLAARGVPDAKEKDVSGAQSPEDTGFDHPLRGTPVPPS